MDESTELLDVEVIAGEFVHLADHVIALKLWLCPPSITGFTLADVLEEVSFSNFLHFFLGEKSHSKVDHCRNGVMEGHFHLSRRNRCQIDVQWRILGDDEIGSRFALINRLATTIHVSLIGPLMPLT